jgi:hypothetical protein
MAGNNLKNLFERCVIISVECETRQRSMLTRGDVLLSRSEPGWRMLAYRDIFTAFPKECPREVSKKCA